MPSTGKHYGLKQNFWFDSRRDVIAATDKALDYLQKLHGDFDDWQLALAGYNWGEGNVGARDRDATRRRGCRPTTRALPMPAETRNYLPKLQAVKNIVRDPEKYGLVARGHSRRAVLHRGEDDAQDGHQARGRARRAVARGVPRAQSAAQPAGDRGRRRALDPAADRQRGDLRGEARAAPTSRSCRGRRIG